MDDLQQKLNQPAQGGGIPTPPPLEIDVRTMETDIKSIQQSGGEVADSGIKSEFVAPKETVGGGVQISGYAGPEKPIFTPSENILTQSGQQQETQASGIGKLVLIIGGILIGAIGLGLLGYYVIFPMIFK